MDDVKVGDKVARNNNRGGIESVHTIVRLTQTSCTLNDGVRINHRTGKEWGNSDNYWAPVFDSVTDEEIAQWEKATLGIRLSIRLTRTIQRHLFTVPQYYEVIALVESFDSPKGRQGEVT